MTELEELKKEIADLKELVKESNASQKATLSFDLSDQYQRAEFKRTMNATSAYIALWEVAQEIFRPHRKHGYDEKMEKLLEACGTFPDPEYGGECCNGSEVISELEDRFYKILENNKINIHEDLE